MFPYKPINARDAPPGLAFAAFAASGTEGGKVPWNQAGKSGVTVTEFSVEFFHDGVDWRVEGSAGANDGSLTISRADLRGACPEGSEPTRAYFRVRACAMALNTQSDWSQVRSIAIPEE